MSLDFPQCAFLTERIIFNPALRIDHQIEIHWSSGEAKDSNV